MQLDLAYAVELLTAERYEMFNFEKEIALLEFQTWIYWPMTNKADSAGMIAATLILEKTEENISWDDIVLARIIQPIDPLVAQAGVLA
jgi:hypothetical protein